MVARRRRRGGARSPALEDRGPAPAPAAAEGGEGRGGAATRALERRGADQSCARCADRMAERARTTVRVHAARVREAELLHERERRARERLVHLDDAHVVEPQAGTLEGA